jgi:hypothetical protein
MSLISSNIINDLIDKIFKLVPGSQQAEHLPHQRWQQQTAMTPTRTPTTIITLPNPPN